MIKKIDKLTIFVSSQEEAKKFWIEKLGFAVMFEQEIAPGMRWLEVAPKGDSNTTLVIYSKEMMLKQNPSTVNHPLIMFKSDNPEKDWQQLKDNGVEITAIEKMPYRTMFSFKDNDGNSYMIKD